MPTPTPPGCGVPRERPRTIASPATCDSRRCRRAAAQPLRFPKSVCSRLTFRPLIARNLAVEQVNLAVRVRSEEHTSELQSPCNLVCRLLLEKKKKQNRSSL